MSWRLNIWSHELKTEHLEKSSEDWTSGVISLLMFPRTWWVSSQAELVARSFQIWASGSNLLFLWLCSWCSRCSSSKYSSHQKAWTHTLLFVLQHSSVAKETADTHTHARAHTYTHRNKMKSFDMWTKSKLMHHRHKKNISVNSSPLFISLLVTHSSFSSSFSLPWLKLLFF